VLDANLNFGTFAEASRMQSRVLGPSVVVGITLAEGADSARRIEEFASEEGAAAFLSFIEQEVKPAVEHRVPVDRERQTLFGHSLGGLFVLRALFDRPDAFQTYIAASPSIWWKDRAILAREEAFRARAGERAVNARLLITVGEFEQSLSPEEAVLRGAEQRSSELLKRRMVDNARDLAGRLAALEARGLRVSFVPFAGETHGSVMPAAISRGLRFALFPNL
jgi:uncharacterized protein